MQDLTDRLVRTGRIPAIRPETVEIMALKRKLENIRQQVAELADQGELVSITDVLSIVGGTTVPERVSA